jgi:hypothetical protein
VDSTGASICKSLEIESYSKVKCLTNAGDIPQTTLQATLDGKTYACANTDTSKCGYEQLTSSLTTPVVASVLIDSDSKMTFTGTNFPAAGFVAQAQFDES